MTEFIYRHTSRVNKIISEIHTNKEEIQTKKKVDENFDIEIYWNGVVDV